ncbi:MAG: imidazolonepropionase-like amidohydrolase [Candidatus Pseudothioglobus sp.]|jgi:imidazolonepropionase-like amidohydrolase
MQLTNLNIWNGIDDGLDLAVNSLTIQADKISRVARSTPPPTTRFSLAASFSSVTPSSFASAAPAVDNEVLDMQGLYVIPGLIDAHVHMCLDPDIRDPYAQDQFSDDELIEKIEQRARQMLAAGITTARDLGGGRWLELVVRDSINAGKLQATRLICAGQPITSVQGHCHFWGGEAADLPEALEVLARQVEHRVDLIKVMATGGNMTPGSTPSNAQFDRELLTEIVTHARQHDCLVAAHCHGTEGIKNAAGAGVTTIEHCSWVGPDGWGKHYDGDAVIDMVSNDVRVSPTINAGWRRYIGNQVVEARLMENFARLRAAGVQLIASTDAGIPGIYHHHLPIALPVFAHFAGLDPVQALRSATSDCARALGLSQVVGQVKPGFCADLVFYQHNPLLDLAQLAAPVAVMSRGAWVDLS